MTKTNTRSRIVSILLVLMMLLTMVPITAVTANAAGWTTVNSFEDLKAAVKAKKEYIKLGQNIDTSSLNEGNGLTISGFLSFEDKNFVLDLNGKTLNLKSNFDSVQLFIQVADGSLTIKDSSSAKTGAITGLFGSIRGGVPCYLIFVGKNGNLTLDGGTFSVQGKPYAFEVEVVRSLNGNVTIKNGAKLIQPEFADSGYALELDGGGYALRAEGKSKVIIDGGEFDGCVKLTGYQDTNGSVQINGGTFKKDVQVLYEAEENNSDPAVAVNGGTFEGNVYLKYWSWRTSLYMPYRLNGGTFKGTVNLDADGGIFKEDKPTSNHNIAMGLDKCFGYSAIAKHNGVFTARNIRDAIDWETRDLNYTISYKLLMKGSNTDPVRIIPNAWGVMESVTLDGKKINYAKDWNGTPVVIKNNEDHTITFKWKDLADELKIAGYRYDAQCMRYSSVDTTGLIPTDQIPTGTEYSFTIRKGTDPKVYSFDLRLDLKKNGVDLSAFTNQHIVRLVLCEAPPAPVAHSITVTNGRGTANPTTAIAGETVTVKAKDDTANNMMFTRWNTDTPGVTFADATKQETTFVMPDCDVKVNPGFRQVSFKKQPIDSWPQVNHGSKAIVTFSAPITKWELKEGNTTVVSSGNLFINTGNPITVNIPKQSSAVEKTYTVVVTANGQKFSSNKFKVSWINWPKAPAVEFTPADGTQFVGEIEVIASDALYAGEEIFEIAYTTDGTDPKTSTTTRYANTDTEHITLTKTTTIKARTYNDDAAADAAKWGPLATATFTKYSDSTLPKPTITPEGTTYTGSITAYLTAPALDGVELEYCLMQTGDPNITGYWETYDPETGITVNDFGTITLYARTSKKVDAETPDGLYYVETLTSENASATYTRTYSAAIDNVAVSGMVGKTMTQNVVIRMNGDRFKNIAAGDDVSAWFNLPAGLTAKVKELSNANGYHGTLTVTISGKPTATYAAAITVTIPKDKLYANNTTDLTVLSNPNAYYSIAMDADHQIPPLPGYMKGDVNNDGKITVDDARAALRAAVKLDVLSAAAYAAADVDGKKGVTVDDARLILRVSVKLDTFDS